jgi:uncharacterized protein YndB with AHSA1/START domain
MPYTYRLTRIIPASPLDVYEAWLDSEAHSQMTGAEARMSNKVGADFAAWDDYIRGRNLELVPGERIVQAWRTSKFTGENEDSIVTITLEEADDGTLLTLVHSNVPDEQRNYEEGGWESNYFAPMRAYFASLAEEDEAEEDVDELEEEEEESAEEHNGDEDDEDDEDEEDDEEEEDEDDEDDDEDEDEDEEDEDEEDEDEEDEDEDEDEDEEDELKEAPEEERVAKGLEEPEHAPRRPPAVKRTASRTAKKAAPRGKALSGKKTKRAAAAPRKAKLKAKPKSKRKPKLMRKAKKKTVAKRARPAAKKAKRAASKTKSAGGKRARRRAQRL